MTKFELFYPLKPYVRTQSFGENMIPLYVSLGLKGHNGWDMIGEQGQLIRSAHDGVVTFTGEDGSGGLGVVVRTTEQYDYEDKQVFYKSIYWHCLPNSFLVKAGDVVKAGTPLARCDTTGKATGAHLHFGIKPCVQGEQDWEWWNLESTNGYGGAIDPAPYWNGYYAEDAQTVIDKLQQIIAILKSAIQILMK